MSRFIFLFLIIVSLVISSASCQEEHKKIPTLDNSSTVEQVETQINEFAQKLREDVKDLESYKKFLQTIGELTITGGEKILKMAKNEEEQEKGYMFKIAGLEMLTQNDRQTENGINYAQKSEHHEKLKTLIGELEKEGKCLSLVNRLRFQEFAQGLNKLYQELTPEKFEQLKKDIRLWVNKKPAPFEPIEPLMIVVQFSESEELSKKDPQVVMKTIQELIAFVNSAECTISEEQKKETVERLEGCSRRCVGAELKLYGKTLDDQDFNWEALRGKYVLVKFTASWCGPCKSEIPGMLKAYKQYHDKGLEIVSVYVWDKLDDVKHAVNEEKLPWFIVSEELTEKANQPPQGKAYGIQGVPTMLLIDKDGKVIDTEIREQKLQSRLAELLDKK
ncbi:MAG: TlpA family protein disulfide reductase [Planctomycetaceae bacterium]|jgi:thiol-disulfide isomerase/thioredoxin|nr:TlpA family protein disulfide reductase [Planctomycetaceae bacterium]